MLKRRLVALSLIFSMLSLPVAAQNGGGDMLSRIRKEAMERFANHENDAHVYGRLWPTADWLAQSQSSGGMGGQTDDCLGLRQCASRTVGLQASGLVERTADRAPDLARQRSTRSRGACMDSEYERNGSGEGVSVGSPGTTDAGAAHNIFE